MAVKNRLASILICFGPTAHLNSFSAGVFPLFGRTDRPVTRPQQQLLPLMLFCFHELWFPCGARWWVAAPEKAIAPAAADIA